MLPCTELQLQESNSNLTGTFTLMAAKLAPLEAVVLGVCCVELEFIFSAQLFSYGVLISFFSSQLFLHFTFVDGG